MKEGYYIIGKAFPNCCFSFGIDDLYFKTFREAEQKLEELELELNTTDAPKTELSILEV